MSKKNDLDFLDEDKKLHSEISKANAQATQEYENLGELKQGSKAWFHMRMGKFTGSKIPNLMKRGRSKADVFGETAKSVIRQVYIERDLTPEGAELYVDEMFNKRFRQTEWGNKYESYAIAAYEEATGNTVDPCAFKTHPILDHIGGSFDGDVVGKKKIIEVKCPYDVLKHDANVQLSKGDYETGVPKTHEYYGQIQCNIFVGDAESCDFISYDPRRKHDGLVIINVPRDNDYIEEMLDRINFSEELIVKYLEYIDIDGALLIMLNEKADAKTD